MIFLGIIWKNLNINSADFPWISVDFESDLDSRRVYNQISVQIKNKINYLLKNTD